MLTESEWGDFLNKGIQKSVESEELLSHLLIIPPDLSAIESLLKDKQYNTAVISRAGYDFADHCFEEDRYYEEEYRKHQYEDAVLDTTRNSAYLPQIIELLLKFGLDPNAICDDYNIMSAVKYVVNEYVAADTLALLFEHGGKTDLSVGGFNMACELDFDIMFDAFNQRDRRAYDSMVHCWFVLLGYSNNMIQDKEAVTVFSEQRCDCEIENFKITDLKQHRNYYFGISNVSGRGENWSLHIFDKRTRWEVARL